MLGSIAVTFQSAGTAYASTNAMAAWGSIWSGQSLYSTHLNYRLTMQSDGNLVDYDSANKVIWAANPGVGHSGGHAELQGDGNLVLIDSNGNAYWHLNPGTIQNPYLTIQDDGNLVIYSTTSTTTWTVGWQVPAYSVRCNTSTDLQKRFQAVASMLLANYGWNNSTQSSSLNYIYTHEDCGGSPAWWPQAQPSGCGDPGTSTCAYGIPQSKPGSKMAAFGPDWELSSETQIAWGLSYIKSVYGTPYAAYQHWLIYHSY